MKISPSLITEKIRKYIIQAIHVEKDKIKEDTLIFKEGFLDSMGFIVLITYLEDEFKIKTNDSDFIEENFESIKAMTNFVLTKLSDQACAELQAS
jgi:acyl carrier protein